MAHMHISFLVLVIESDRPSRLNPTASRGWVIGSIQVSAVGGTRSFICCNVAKACAISSRSFGEYQWTYSFNDARQHGGTLISTCHDALVFGMIRVSQERCHVSKSQINCDPIFVKFLAEPIDIRVDMVINYCNSAGCILPRVTHAVAWLIHQVLSSIAYAYVRREKALTCLFLVSFGI